jgi:hypothetical protein
VVPEILPPYVVQRDRLAATADISIEREWIGYRRDAALITRYVGTLDALKRSPLITDKAGIRIPLSTKHCVKSGVWSPEAPERRALVGAFRRGDGLFYVKYLDPWPLEFGRLQHGTEWYTYPQWLDAHAVETAVYMGPKAALIADGVMPVNHAPTETQSAEEVIFTRAHRFVLWECNELDDGRLRYTKHVATTKRAEQEQADEASGARRYTNGEEFREDAISSARALFCLVAGFSERPQAGDSKYCFDDRTVERIHDLSAQVLATLQAAPVVTKLNRPDRAAPALRLVK